MAGNVSEYCFDDFHRYFSRPDTQSLSARVGSIRFRHTFVDATAKVIRGGSWATPKCCTLSMYPILGRWGADPEERLDFVGFRCAVSLPMTPSTAMVLQAAVDDVKTRWRAAGTPRSVRRKYTR
jgi:formylglycine-generating enzyme required for sulfatase activity